MWHNVHLCHLGAALGSTQYHYRSSGSICVAPYCTVEFSIRDIATCQFYYWGTGAHAFTLLHRRGFHIDGACRAYTAGPYTSYTSYESSSSISSSEYSKRPLLRSKSAIAPSKTSVSSSRSDAPLSGPTLAKVLQKGISQCPSEYMNGRNYRPPLYRCLQSPVTIVFGPESSSSFCKFAK